MYSCLDHCGGEGIFLPPHLRCARLIPLCRRQFRFRQRHLGTDILVCDIYISQCGELTLDQGRLEAKQVNGVVQLDRKMCSIGKRDNASIPPSHILAQELHVEGTLTFPRCQAVALTLDSPGVHTRFRPRRISACKSSRSVDCVSASPPTSVLCPRWISVIFCMAIWMVSFPGVAGYYFDLVPGIEIPRWAAVTSTSPMMGLLCLLTGKVTSKTRS